MDFKSLIFFWRSKVYSFFDETEYLMKSRSNKKRLIKALKDFDDNKNGETHSLTDENGNEP